MSIDHDSASRAIVARLQDLLDPTLPTLTFLPMANEVDLTPLDHPNLLVTRTPNRGPLTVHEYDAVRETHPWGYDQPAAGAATVAPAEIEVALVPGVVFGRDGTRIGHGKGYYDQLLASCGEVTALGITFEALLVDALPSEAHDFPMDAVVTERGVTGIPGGRSWLSRRTRRSCE